MWEQQRCGAEISVFVCSTHEVKVCPPCVAGCLFAPLKAPALNDVLFSCGAHSSLPGGHFQFAAGRLHPKQRLALVTERPPQRAPLAPDPAQGDLHLPSRSGNAALSNFVVNGEFPEFFLYPRFVTPPPFPAPTPPPRCPGGGQPPPLCLPVQGLALPRQVTAAWGGDGSRLPTAPFLCELSVLACCAVRVTHMRHRTPMGQSPSRTPCRPPPRPHRSSPPRSPCPRHCQRMPLPLLSQRCSP